MKAFLHGHRFHLAKEVMTATREAVWDLPANMFQLCFQHYTNVGRRAYAYDELNRINDQGSPCSRVCVQLHLLGRIPCEQFHLNQNTVPVSSCLLTCLVAVFSVVAILAFSRWRIVTSVVDHTGNTMFCLQLWSCWETSDHRQHYWSGHHKSSCNHHVGLASGCMPYCAV